MTREDDYIQKEQNLLNQLEWIRDISSKIDEENHSLMDRYSNLKEVFSKDTIEKLELKRYD
jgi:hypothetical protein